jgi:hypothetical protein
VVVEEEVVGLQAEADSAVMVVVAEEEDLAVEVAEVATKVHRQKFAS